MNKNIIYIGIAVSVGLLAGWLIFGGSADESINVKNVSDMSDVHDNSGESMSKIWTCSMHPRIKQEERGDCPICGMELIPAESGDDGVNMNEIKMTKNAMALANIQTTVVGSGKISEDDGMISLSGKIMVNQEEMATQPAHFNGRVERLFVQSLGEKVQKGQRVATIYSPALVAAQQELLSVSKTKASQPALYKAVRNKFKNWKIHDTILDEIESSGNILASFPIYSHVSGVVTEITVQEGSHIMDGHPIFKVSNLNSVWAEFDAYENQIANLKKDQKIKVVSHAYPNKEFNATVSFIDPMLNNLTRTVTVRATLKNTDNLFKPGMFVTGKLKGAMEIDGEMLSVPASAIMWTGKRSLVYVKTNPNEPVFEMRDVSLGNRNGENYMITDGLENGDEIVTNGTFTVDAAAQLQGKKSMMNEGLEDEAMMPIQNMKMKFSAAFQKDFKSVLKPYLQLKDAFVASDTEQVSAFAKATSKPLKSIERTNLGNMEQSHLKKSMEMLDAIAKSNDLKNQREHFVTLNENLVGIAINIKGIEPMLYVQKCPMANNNKGAMWLSAEDDIRNPYYGDVMLTCGSIINVIE